MLESVNQAGTEMVSPPQPVDGGENAGADLLGLPVQEESQPTAGEEALGVNIPRQEDPQDKVGRAFAAERRRLEQKFRRELTEKLGADPAAKLGRRLIEDIAKQHGVDGDKAAQMAEESFLRGLARREGVSPNVARAVFLREQEGPARRGDGREAPEEFGRRVREELAAAELPDGFDFDESVGDIAFVELLHKYPAEAAARIYHSERRASNAPLDIAEKMLARRSLPQPLRGSQPASPAVDFTAMSDEAFLEYRRALKNQR